MKKGIFVGYNRNSPADLVFYPEDNRVLKHRLIRFICNVINQLTQIHPTDDDDDYFPLKKYVQNKTSATTPDPQIKITKHRIIHRPRKIVSFDVTPEEKENLLNT